MAIKNKNSLRDKNLISIGELTRSEIEIVLSLAKSFKRQKNHRYLENKIIAMAFFEPSTRTRLSFETAVLRLAGKVIGFSDTRSTSLAKGESLEDTVRMLSSYADAIVIRHPDSQSAFRASKVSTVPVLNGGDGDGEHPTQTLLDLFSILETQGKIDGLTIGLSGDLKYGRTVHSLAKALKYYKVKLILMSDPLLAMPEKIIQECQESGLKIELREKLDLTEIDVLYMTRYQKERWSHELDGVEPFVLSAADLLKVPAHFKILHPLPRVNELSTDVDLTPYAYYFQQAENGLFVRQALLSLILSDIRF